MLPKKIISIICLLLIFTVTNAQTVNSKVSMQDASGKSYTGVITAVRGDKYYVKYDGVDFSAWLSKNQFTVTSEGNTTKTPGVSRFDVQMTDEQNAAIPD